MKFSMNMIVSIVAGLIMTVVIVYSLGLNGSGRSGPPIIVAASQIEAGTLIQKKDIKLIYWQNSETPPQSFATIDALNNRVARQTIYNGEPILEAKLAPVGSKAGMESLISMGKRAITVRVNDVIGVAGFALPGSYIDIIANVRDNQGQSYSKVVLNRVKVLAIAQETEVDKTKPKVVSAVTIELTPEESERLDLARSIGTLSLVLRNELDMSVETSKGAKMQDLIKNHPLSTDESNEEKMSGESSKKNQDLKNAPTSSGYVDQIRGSNRNRKNTENE